jgi:hypothetical protein
MKEVSPAPELRWAADGKETAFLVQSACQRLTWRKLVTKNGASWRAYGARQTTRVACRKKDVGTHILYSIQIHP